MNISSPPNSLTCTQFLDLNDMEDTTFPVPVAIDSVQDLATKLHGSTPSRYIRLELTADVVSTSDKGSVNVPIIDLNKLTDEEFCLDEMAKLHDACKDWGFFQLTNHGVDDGILEKMKRDVMEFFKLPIVEKKALYKEPIPTEGYGWGFVFSDEQKLDWGDLFYLITQPDTARNMKVWPTIPPTFREILLKYSEELERITKSVLGLMGKNLGIEEEKFANMFEKGLQSMRLNYYPPCPEHDKVLGISPHSDATGITFLVQVNHVQGLQIKHDGHWFPVALLPDAILVNIGDVLEILTNGIYKSIEHRVIINKEKERVSVAAFHETNETVMIGPLLELVKEGEDVKFKSLNFDEYTKLMNSHELNGKNQIDLMRLKK